MRVTANTFPDTLVQQLNDLAARQNQLQTEAATGQRIQWPEDDPVAAQRVLDLRSQSQALDQYQKNIAANQAVATAAFDSLNGLKKISDRASEVATMADGLKSPDELKAYASEVGQLIQQALQIANSQQAGSYLFGGTRSDQPPFVAQTDSNGNVTGVTYNGNAQVAQNEIDQGVTFTAQIPGANTSGTGPSGLITDAASGADFFNHLIRLQSHLQSGDTQSIAQTDRANLGKDEDHIILQLSSNSALQARLETAASSASQQSASLQKLTSNEVDADMAQTIVRLNQTQSAYQAALQTGGLLLNHSLLDYLK